jgi:hypothetical protein
VLATIRSLALVLGSAAAIACGRGADGATPLAKASPAETASSALPATPKASGPAPTTAFTLAASAYAAELELDDEALYVLTSSAAYRIVPGRPPERWALDLGISPVLAGEHLVYWSEGALRRASKRGGPSEIVAEVPRRPQRLSASGGHLAWLDQAEDGHFTLWALDGARPRELLTPQGYISALTLLDDQAFFVEQVAGSGYRLGAVALSGGDPRYTSVARGRTPAMLAAARDISYYDGPTHTVRRVGPDLEREVTIARDIICSPLAVAEHVYCAQPAGLVELPSGGGPARVLSDASSGSITDIAASTSRVAWLVDAGRDKLEVRTVALR